MPKDQKYTVQALENMTKAEIAEMRKEYTRMRDIAEKRIKRLGESEFAYARAYQNNQLGFPKLRNLSDSEFPKAMSALAKFVSAKGTTVTGQRERMKRTIEAWQAQGVDLNESNYKQVMKAMESLRKRKLIYDSNRVVNAVEAILARSDMKLGRLMRSPNFGKLLEKNSDAIASLPELPKGQYYGMRSLKNMFGW